MLEMFYPHEYAESVFAIDYDKLFIRGYRGVIFDIDNTLVHHGENSTYEVDSLFERIHSIGFRTLLLSDNTEERVKRFIRNIDTMYICDACKPRREGYIKAIEMLGMDRSQIIYIGDQIFTDIYGANRCGIDNILVKYMRYEGEKKIGKRRQLEGLILKLYKRNRHCCGRLGNICTEENTKNAVE